MLRIVEGVWNCHFTDRAWKFVEYQPLGSNAFKSIIAQSRARAGFSGFTWDGETPTFDHNLIKLRAFQNDGAPTPEGQGDEEQQIMSAA